MAKGLKVGNKQDGYIALDEFYKSLMFQKIIDSNFSRNERDVLLVIFRKTIHFDKWQDRLSMYWLTQAVGISRNTLKATLIRLDEKGLLDICKSVGGKTKSPKKYNEFGLSNYLINDVYSKWEQIKKDNGIEITYNFD